MDCKFNTFGCLPMTIVYIHVLLFFSITNLSFYTSDIVTSEFLIRDPIRVGKIKNIDPSTLPNFNVVVNKYLDKLLFEFNVLY